MHFHAILGCRTIAMSVVEPFLKNPLAIIAMYALTSIFVKRAIPATTRWCTTVTMKSWYISTRTPSQASPLALLAVLLLLLPVLATGAVAAAGEDGEDGMEDGEDGMEDGEEGNVATPTPTPDPARHPEK